MPWLGRSFLPVAQLVFRGFVSEPHASFDGCVLRLATIPLDALHHRHRIVLGRIGFYVSSLLLRIFVPPLPFRRYEYSIGMGFQPGCGGWRRP